MARKTAARPAKRAAKPAARRAPEPQPVKAKLKIEHILRVDIDVPENHFRNAWGNLLELSQSITDHGILTPLKVRPSPHRRGRFEVMGGVRRYRASGRDYAGLLVLPCLVMEVNDAEAIEIQALDNLHRTDLHPIDLALCCRALIDTGHDADQIARRLSVSRADVARWLRLCQLSPAARKAFVAGAFTERDALALVGIGTSPARQADVLAALNAGAIQAADLVDYCRREFTAPLVNLPWRLDDEQLVAKAGACAACPKRSDVQRDLFGADLRGIHCLDAPCFKAKMEASWKLALARPGVVQADAQPGDLFIPDDPIPVVAKASGFVDADGKCDRVTGRTWREVVFSADVLPDGTEGPTVYLARDMTGRPRYLLNEGAATRLARRSPLARAEAASDRAADPVRDDKLIADKTAIRSATKARKAWVAGLAAAVAKGDDDLWPWVTERLIADATPRCVTAVVELLAESIRNLKEPEQRALTGAAALQALAQHSNQRGKRVAAALLVFSEADATHEITGPLNELAELVGYDPASATLGEPESPPAPPADDALEVG